MSRWKRYCEIYLFCSVWPIMTIGGVVGGWKLLMWSYGGRESFRQLIMKDPYEEQWYLGNPRSIFYREAPLGSVPTHLVEKPAGDPDGHKHHNNY